MIPQWVVAGSVAYVMDRGCVADAFYADSPEEAEEYAERMNQSTRQNKTQAATGRGTKHSRKRQDV